jgi:hypothetical protein
MTMQGAPALDIVIPAKAGIQGPRSGSGEFIRQPTDGSIVDRVTTPSDPRARI